MSTLRGSLNPFSDQSFDTGKGNPNKSNTSDSGDRSPSRKNDSKIKDSLLDTTISTTPKPASPKEIDQHNKPKESTDHDSSASDHRFELLPDFTVITRLIRPVINFLFLILGLILLITMLIQITPYISALSSINNAKLRLTCILLTIGSFILLVVVCFWIRHIIVRRYFSFNCNLDIPILMQLAEREDLRNVSEVTIAKDQLAEYVKKFEPENKKGILQDEKREILRRLKCNLEEGKINSPREWLEKYKEFQSELDEAAKTVIATYAFRTGLSTALSPKALADRFLVLFMSLSMIKDLLLLYEVKPRLGETSLIFASTVFNVYIGGKAQWLVKQGADFAKDSDIISSVKATWHIFKPKKSDTPDDLTDSCDDLTDKAAEIFGVNIIANTALKHAAKMATEGLVNALLIKRLGMNLISVLQPAKLKGSLFSRENEVG